MVRITIMVEGDSFLIGAMASMPFITGISRSIKIASGGDPSRSSVSKHEALEKHREQLTSGSAFNNQVKCSRQQASSSASQTQNVESASLLFNAASAACSSMTPAFIRLFAAILYELINRVIPKSNAKPQTKCFVNAHPTFFDG